MKPVSCGVANVAPTGQDFRDRLAVFNAHGVEYVVSVGMLSVRTDWPGRLSALREFDGRERTIVGAAGTSLDGTSTPFAVSAAASAVVLAIPVTYTVRSLMGGPLA
jgi:hypothetical protein